MAYPMNASGSVPASPSLPEVERRVLDYWAGDKTFPASVDARPAGVNGANEYVFYDGPPFANGLPHYGHLLTGYVKDAVPRYQTMRGRRVEGWETAELLAPYGEWQGLASELLLLGWTRGLVPGADPDVARRTRLRTRRAA